MPTPLEPAAPVWCLTGPGFPVGARVTRATGDGRLWLDVCMFGQHLPQMYRPAELHPLESADCGRLGLCPDCLGFGTLALLDGVYPYGVGDVPGRCATVADSRTGRRRPA